jgi:hypothetical protein
MLPRTAGLGLVLLVSACAGTNRSTRFTLESAPNSPGLFVGHSETGDVVVAATHYLAMAGLATTDTDLGLPGRQSGSGEMLCRREMLTGTHLPRWICRYYDDIESQRERLHSELSVPRFSPDRNTFGPPISGRSGPGHAVLP